MSTQYQLLSERLTIVEQQIKAISATTIESIKVGDVYVTTLDHANAAAVATHHGYGVWERTAEGRALVGLSKKSGDIAEYKTIGAEFGENTHTLTIDEMPAHKHSQGDLYNKFMAKAADINAAPDSSSYIGSGSGLTVNGADNANPSTEHQVSQMSAKAWTESVEQSIGGGQAHNNIPPSLVVAIWRRTA